MGIHLKCDIVIAETIWKYALNKHEQSKIKTVVTILHPVVHGYYNRNFNIIMKLAERRKSTDIPWIYKRLHKEIDCSKEILCVLNN